MPVTDDPSWPAYKAALHQLAQASSRVSTLTQAQSVSELQDAECAFQRALAAYQAARLRLACVRAEEVAADAQPSEGALHLNGQIVRVAALEAHKDPISFGPEPP